MVLTRPQAAAQAAAQAARPQAAAQAAAQAAHPNAPDQDFAVAEAAIVEQHKETALQPTSVELVPGVGEHLTEIAQYFLAQTQALVAEHLVLQTQQQGQNEAQSAALMAVQATTESTMNQLTAQQQVIAERFQGEFVRIQTVIRDQLVHLRAVQEDQRLKIEQEVANKPDQAMSEVQRVYEARESARSEGVKHLEDQLSIKVGGSCDAQAVRMQHLEDQLKDKGAAEYISHQATELVHHLQEKSTNEMKEHIEHSLQLGFKLARDELKQELASTPPISESLLQETVQKLVLDETAKAERHIGAQIQRALTTEQSAVNLATQRQVMIRQYCMVTFGNVVQIAPGNHGN